MKNSIHRLSLTAALLSMVGLAWAQDITQTIRGTLKDKDSQVGMVAAAVAVYKDSILISGTSTDPDGHFKIEDIPVGRYTIVASYVGYNPVVLQNIIVNSGKEVVLILEMEESAIMAREVVVTAVENKGDASNNMAMVSARGFTVDETERYAGSRQDPARMASNFAGVQGSDDSSNDIIVRGNSPLGLLWRLEGVNIPNPNHFGVAGTTGGQVSILNNKLLSNSDFFTGAFPAEYGNTVAGVFDLKMRKGNNEKFEFSGQWGLFGTELLAEGPLNKNKKSSFLLNYRYSTAAIFNLLGINIGTDATPYYQDASFKLNFPMGKAGNLSFFGIGGISHIDLIKSDQMDTTQVDIYGDADVDEYYGTHMGVFGSNYVKSLGPKSYMKVTLSATREHQHNFNDKIHRHIGSTGFVLDSLTPHLGYDFNQHKWSASVFVNHKVNARHALRGGMITDRYSNTMADSIFEESLGAFRTRLDYQGTMYLNQPFIQWRFKSTEKVIFNLGVHAQYLTLNDQMAIEPRAGFRWRMTESSSLSFGLGMHSQMMPTYLYFAMERRNGWKNVMNNRHVGFTKSNQLALSYDNAVNKNCRIKVETYYQQLTEVPVTMYMSSYSILNAGTELNRFFPDSLTNKGEGHNVGVELTLERFYSNNWFGMVTASVFDSKYKGSNGIEYNTAFNGRFATNFLGGYEWKWEKKRSTNFGVGGKITWAGGRRFTPIDIAASDSLGYGVEIDSKRNSQQFRNYFRTDIKLHYKINTQKVTHEIGIDLVNVTGQKNVLKQSYTGGDPPIREEYQYGFLPVFYYKIDF